MHRFFSNAPLEPDKSETAELSGSEHQHLAKVMRMSAGDEVTLFDGTGFEFQATIETVGRNATTLSIQSCEFVDRELAFQLTMGVALPKGDRQQWLIEKLVELGVTRLTPLITRRGVAQPGEKAMQRIQRWIVAASKQSRRNRLMAVTPAQTIEQYFSRQTSNNETGNEGEENKDTLGESLRLIAHPASESQLMPVLSAAKRDVNIRVAIGPEGGFANEEITDAMNCQATPVCLGQRILRIETAAIAVATCIVFRESS